MIVACRAEAGGRQVARHRWRNIGERSEINFATDKPVVE
jgi:hypothetical protein